MTDLARAAVLTEFGKPLEIQEFPILAPEPGGLLVAVEAATVCGTDVHNWQGHTSSLKPPVVPGHEGVGRIIALRRPCGGRFPGHPAGTGRSRRLGARELRQVPRLHDAAGRDPVC